MPVWNPFLAKDIDQLEKVQHRATQLECSTLTEQLLPFEERLQHLQLFVLLKTACQPKQPINFSIIKLLLTPLISSH